MLVIEIVRRAFISIEYGFQEIILITRRAYIVGKSLRENDREIGRERERLLIGFSVKKMLCLSA